MTTAPETPTHATDLAERALIGTLLADPSRLAVMGRASAEMARPQAARDIAHELLAAARQRPR